MNEDSRSGWYDTRDSAGKYMAVLQQAEAKPVRKKHSGMKVTMIIVCVLVLITASAVIFSEKGSFPEPEPGEADYFGGSIGPYEDYRDYFDNYFTDDTSLSGSRIESFNGDAELELELKSSEGRQQLSLQDLYSRCSQSVVGIYATSDEYSGYSWGSGIVMSEDGYILTNAHVIANSDYASVVCADESTYDAVLVGEDAQSDLAVLKIDAAGLAAAEFGDSGELRVGDSVAAIGNPLGYSFSGTLTNGIVSAIDRSIEYNGHLMTLIQTNAALNEGNSGGALFNMYGEVIGVTNMKSSASFFSEVSIEGMGYAIPSVTVKEVVDQLICDGIVSGRPGIGITVGAMGTDAAGQYELPDGLYISEVSKGSDAEAKGIQVGDILTAVNGEAVYTTSDVNFLKDGCDVGDTIILTIYRDGDSFDVEVVLMDMNELY